MSQVVVVGGGVTGLAAARRLALAGLEVTVLEAGSRWGGKLAPVVVDGVRLDGGAESMLARRPQPAALVAALGRADALVHPTSAKPAVLVGGELRRLPPSVLGVPTDVDQLRGLLSGPAFALAVPFFTSGFAGVAMLAKIAPRFAPPIASTIPLPATTAFTLAIPIALSIHIVSICH